MKVDLIGDIGEEGGIGNYSTKLYEELKKRDDVTVNPVKLKLSTPILSSTFQSFFEVPYRIWKSDADVIHITNQDKASGLAFMPRNKLKNVVVTVHDISPRINDYSGPVSSIISWFYCKGVKKVGKIIAISKFTKQELVKHLNIDEDKIDVIYQGVGSDHFYPRERDEEILDKYEIETPYILYVGSEIDRKNMEGVMRKFKELQEQNPELTLVKVGSAGRQKYREKTLNYMEKYGLKKGKDVIFTGFVDEEDLPQIYSSAERTVLWSHYEGFGRSTLESKACGTDIITKDEPPMNEWSYSNNKEDFDWKEVTRKIKLIYEGI